MGKLPAEIAQCKNLKVLSVFDNQLFGNLPSSIGRVRAIWKNWYYLIMLFLVSYPTVWRNWIILKHYLLSNNNFKGNYANLQQQLPNIINIDIDEANTQGVLVTLDED